MELKCLDCKADKLKQKTPPYCQSCLMVRWRNKRKKELVLKGYYGYCQWCRKPKSESHQTFCSLTCLSKYKISLTPQGNRVCRNCSKKFRTNPAYIVRRQTAGIYCCRKCMLDYAHNHPSVSVDKQGYLIRQKKRLHRDLMEVHLGRKLGRREYVHHINFTKTDNRLENLVVLSASEHSSLHSKDRWKKQRDKLKRDELFSRLRN